MNFLVTGGAGFIGSWMCKKLFSRFPDCNIIILDNLCSGTLGHISELLDSKRVSFYEVDLKDFSLIETYFKDVNYVYHFAANPDIAKAAADPTVDFYEGTLLTQNVVEAARRGNVSNIVYASGSGVYGEKGSSSVLEDGNMMRPISPYGASKLGCESILCAYSYMYNMRVSCFRFGNVVGGKQTHGVGYDFLKRLRNNPTKLSILGDGTQNKPYVYIADVIDALTLLPSNQKNQFDVFNIAPKDTITVNEIAKCVIEILEIPENKVQFEYSGGDRGWKGDVPEVHLDTTKARLLGWKNLYSSRQAIIASINDMMKIG